MRGCGGLPKRQKALKHTIILLSTMIWMRVSVRCIC